MPLQRPNVRFQPRRSPRSWPPPAANHVRPSTSVPLDSTHVSTRNRTPFCSDPLIGIGSSADRTGRWRRASKHLANQLRRIDDEQPAIGVKLASRRASNYPVKDSARPGIQDCPLLAGTPTTPGHESKVTSEVRPLPGAFPQPSSVRLGKFGIRGIQRRWWTLVRVSHAILVEARQFPHALLK
jgi:hypothetical protein